MPGTRTANMIWRDTRLFYFGRRTPYEIVRDETYSHMWRVKYPDGRLSDMVNRTRAKDAAMTMLDRDLRVAGGNADAV